MINTKQKKVYCLLCSLISLLILAYLLFKILDMLSNIYSVSQLFFSFDEVRDYVGIRLSQFIVEGINPYKIDTAESFTVPFLYQYTCFTPVLVGLLCKITGVSIIAGNYILNFLYVLLTAYSIYLLFTSKYSKTVHKIILYFAILINTTTFFSMFGNIVVTFRPDAAGIFICSLIFLIAFRDEQRTELLAALTVILILTKQFLIVFSFPLFVYLSIRENIKTAVKYAVECVAFGICLYLVVSVIFPLYWTESIYGQYVCFTNGKISLQLNDAMQNLRAFFIRYRSYWVLCLVLLAVLIHYNIRKGTNKSQGLYFFIEQHSFAFYVFLNILTGVLTCIYVARNGGDGYKYCGELIGPNLFIFVLLLLTGFDFSEKKEFLTSTLLMVLAFTTLLTIRNFKTTKYNTEDIENYQKVYSILDSYSNAEKEMYIGMLANGWLLKNDLIEPENIWFNDGHTEYFNTNTEGGSRIADFIFYGKADVGRIAQEYVKTVNEKVTRKEFSIIALSTDEIISEQILKENYYLDDIYNLKADNNSYNTEFWLPKNE